MEKIFFATQTKKHTLTGDLHSGHVSNSGNKKRNQNMKPTRISCYWAP